MQYKIAYVVMHVKNLDNSVQVGVELKMPILRRNGQVDVARMARKSEPLLLGATKRCGVSLADLGSIAFQHGDEMVTVMGDELRAIHAQRQK